MRRRSCATGRTAANWRWRVGECRHPFFALQGKRTDPGVTNIHNVKSPHWRRWLGPENRCLVPFTSFSENEVLPDGRRPPVWFALGQERPLACFAGIWAPGWTSVRKLKEGEVAADLFGFLTTEPNAEVGAVHPKAMPVILTTHEECSIWMSAPATEALALHGHCRLTHWSSWPAARSRTRRRQSPKPVLDCCSDGCSPEWHLCHAP